MVERLRWGILATGKIADVFAAAVTHSNTGVLQAVAGRDNERARGFAARHNIPNIHRNYAALLEDPEVEAVYIANLNPDHAEWTVKAIEAGKHVLCEKPLTLNAPTAMAVIDTADRHDVFLMEAFMYRCHPQTRRLVELLREGIIGKVLSIEASFSCILDFDPAGRGYAPDLGGGAILDLGSYTVSMARLIAGVAGGGRIAEPLEFKAFGRLAPSGVDDNAVAIMRFPGDILAQVSCGFAVNHDNTVRIGGTDGSLMMRSPWIPAREGGSCSIEHLNNRGESREYKIETREWIFGIEADWVASAIRNGERQAAFPAPSWEDTLGNMRVLDQWRTALGLVYPSEKPGRVKTIDRRPPARRANAVMTYGSITGIDKPVARLVMGADNQRDPVHAAVMFDDYFSAGGNCFDTARIYGNAEILLGQWTRDRALRDQIVILDKGAHTPFCTPVDMDRQLNESLERLRTDYVDVYMFHRDNPDVPIGEFVDAVNRRVADGSVKAYGVSNWTIARIDAANAYAKQHGLQPVAAVSNNFSLARMVNPVWEGCLSMSDAGSRSWLRENRITLMPWSSQARGFFTGRAAPDRHDDEELVRCWYSDDNFARRERAVALAREKGVSPVAVALAYVLCQPFITFPLIGPRRLRETADSLTAIALNLTPAELAWLNLETERV